MRHTVVLVLMAVSACGGPDAMDVTQSGDGGASQTPSDSAVNDSGVPPNWSCLGERSPTVPTGNVLLELLFNDSSQAPTSPPIVGADVHVCEKLDIDCQNPSGDVVAGGDGVARLTVPGGFSGYYEVKANGFTPAVIARTPQLSNELHVQGLATLALLSRAASLVGVSQDPNLSVAIVTAFDCASAPSAGIGFDVASPGSTEKVVYVRNNLPAASATETDTGSGVALIFNVPSGPLEVTAAFAANHQPIRTISTIARKDWVTFLEIRPDQATHPPIP